MRLGYFLSTEEYGPAELLEQARLAEEAGFSALWISDHYLPWNTEQRGSPMVWPMIGAVSQVCRLPITTAVTCPTTRIHPAIIAQAAATSAVLTQGRFTLGVGTGEALNEHVLGDRWPVTDVRLAMLEEAVEVIRALWSGRVVNHHGRYYTVEAASITVRPRRPPKIYVSALGDKSVEVAGRIADGYISAAPDARRVARFRQLAGANAPCQAGMKACYAPDEESAVAIAHRLWPNSGLPGELARILPTPRHFDQAARLVPPEAMRKQFACGPDPARQLEMIETYRQAGFDELYVTNIGPHYRELISLYANKVLPELPG